jgi:hypothetical protein
LRKLETTLERLKTKAMFYEEQMDYYNRYIETCLDNLAGKETMYVYVCVVGAPRPNILPIVLPEVSFQ